MGKFLLGLVTGAILIVLIGVIGFFAIASLRSKPPAVAEDSTLVLHLWGSVPEKPPVEFDIPGVVSRNSITVEMVWSMLRRAAQDNRIKAVIFEPEGADVGWGTMQEIRADLEAFRKSGKPLYAFLKSPNLRDYYMATAASRISTSRPAITPTVPCGAERLPSFDTFRAISATSPPSEDTCPILTTNAAESPARTVSPPSRR